MGGGGKSKAPWAILTQTSSGQLLHTETHGEKACAETCAAMENHLLDVGKAELGLGTRSLSEQV